jgi:integrating conjugative element membrane protein (TIGR03747 family)
MSTAKTSTRHPRHRKAGVWEHFVALTLGNFFTFIWWSISAVFISILIEWVGMYFWWDHTHSKIMLEEELKYLSSFNRNLLTGLYPGEIADIFMGHTQHWMEVTHLQAISEGFTRSSSWVFSIIGYGLASAIDTVFIFAVRLAVCVSAITGFVLVAIVALVDGLTERDIRKACGGNESAMRYHHAKRLIFPSIALSFGFYLTLPITIHPALVFLPIMAVMGFAIYVTASTFKKFL